MIAARRAPLACALGAAALYAGAVAALSPYRAVFSFDPDEGANAMKALLLERGDALYTQVWSDQPPLFTHLLGAWCGAVGWSADSGRLLVLLFAAALVFAVYDVARLQGGHGAALAACALLGASLYFPRLSVSLMIGLPAIALATLSLWALCHWLHGGRGAWLGAASVLMGCSLATKLFTTLLLPVLAAWLVWAPRRTAAPGTSWRAAALWLSGSAVTAAVLLLALVGPAQLHLLVAPHVAARQAPALERFGPLALVATGAAEWPLTLLALGSYALLLVRRQRIALVFPAWAVAATVSLLGHAPVWYHHQLLLSVPHCAAAGIGLAMLFRRAPAAAPPWLLPWLRAGAAALVVALPVVTARSDRLPAPVLLASGPERVLAAMREQREVTRVALAADAMYAFRAGYPVPPQFSQLSLKRVAIDPNLHREIDALFAERPPDQVVLPVGAADDPAGWMRQAMEGRYRLLVAAGGTEAYLRSDLWRAPADTATPGREERAP